MTFKEIVNKVRLHSGFQGVVASVEATDYVEYMAEAVRSSWSDLQNQREDWKFMWEEISFNTSAGVFFYSDDDLMTNAGNAFNVAKWKTDSFYKDGDKMVQVSWEEYKDKQDELEADSNKYFVVKEYRDSGLYVFCDNTVSTIEAEFYRTPQILEKNTDVPLLPEEFHYIIVYRALEDVASYLGNPSIYERHSFKHDVLENKLMRSQIPAKFIKKKPIYRSRLGYQVYRSN